jgi:iron(III) transport system substrate-binding protein
MNRRRKLLAGGAAGLGLAAVGAPLQAQGNPDWDKVVAGAKKEGKVVLYTGSVGVGYHHAIARLFEKRYGVRVEILEARASELRERIRTEQSAGRYIGDVSHNGQTTTALQALEGTFQPHGGLPGTAKLLPQFTSDAIRAPIFIFTYGILVNTRLVKPGEEPRSWTDLLDPKWKGRILCDDLRALGGGSVLFFVMTDKYGRGFHDKLARQNPVFTRDQRASERRVAQGEFPLWIPQVYSNVAQYKGLPVRLVMPAEGATYVTYEVAMLKNAPNPNAARLLMDYFLSEEAQLVYANTGHGVTVRGVVEKATEDMRALAGAKLLGTTDYRRQNDMLALAKEIYK